MDFNFNNNTALIAYKFNDRVLAIYCQNDGQPEKLGRILYSSYGDKNIGQLIELGNIENIDWNINTVKQSNTPYCSVYNSTSQMIKQNSDLNYIYMYSEYEQEWFIWSKAANQWTLLSYLFDEKY